MATKRLGKGLEALIRSDSFSNEEDPISTKIMNALVGILGKVFDFPEDGYEGNYIKVIAHTLIK